jgi:hypothetical protein
MDVHNLLPRLWLCLLGREAPQFRKGRYICLAMFTLIPPAIGRAENWSSFRGPLGTGVSIETGTPLTWDSEWYTSYGREARR